MENPVTYNTEDTIKNIIKDIECQMRSVPFRNEGKKIKRNDTCPCGSKIKFKKCCLILKQLG